MMAYFVILSQFFETFNINYEKQDIITEKY